MYKDMIENDPQIKLAIILKTNQLKREVLSTLTYKHVEKTLYGFVWKGNYPKSINKAVDDILKLDISTIVGYLSLDAIQRGAELDTDKLAIFMKGDIYE